MDGSKPDLLVGIDFGMTCTGVAYANLSIGSDSIKWIQKWPGRSQANENKVPTTIVYPKNESIPCSWGFLSEMSPERTAVGKDYKNWFKTYLDPLRLNQAQFSDRYGTPKSNAEVEKYYTDYLRLLYRHVETKLGPEIQGATWQQAKIEFVFAVPTTWSPTVVETFRTVIYRAGFGSWPGHNVSMGLTEAEAAAVHTSIEASGIFKEKDVLLVCDAGGGTTDLSVLRVTDTRSRALCLEQLDVVFGATIGSAAIDQDFQRLAMKRLEQADSDGKLFASPENASWEMMKSQDFQNTKCEHGGLDDTPVFRVPISKVDPSYFDVTAGIGNGEMRFNREDLKALFDRQVQKLIKLIDSQLHNMQQKHPTQPVAHLVLSGGLGHSPYVQEQLRARYATGGGHQNARNIQVRIAPDPQLAVCKGVVADRIRKLRAGTSVLSYRCCRASYGTICKELYNKDNPQHAGRATILDSMNGKPYVTQSIAWFIIKGEPVSTDKPIVHNFARKLQPGDPRKAFPTSIVVSHVEKSILPHHMGPDAQILCEVQSDLSAADEKNFKRKNRHFWTAGKTYLRVDYQVRVLIGPADILFELWFNGQKLNKDHPIKVEWATGTTIAPEPEISLWDEDPVWRMGSPTSSTNLRPKLQMAGAKILPHQQRRASQSRLEIEAPLRILEITLMDAESFLEGYKKLETFSQHIPVRIERVEGFKRNQLRPRFTFNTQARPGALSPAAGRASLLSPYACSEISETYIMPDFPPVRACIFDSDGLLINSEDIYSITMNDVLHEYGLPDIPWTVKATQQSRGRQGFVNVMEWAKLPISVDEFMAKVSANKEPFRQCELLPGVRDLFRSLTQHTTQQPYLALASSGDRKFFLLKTERFTDVLSVIPLFHRIFGDDGCMYRCKGKPSPVVFTQSLQRLNDALPRGERPIEPLECLVFEDSTAGVEAGRRAGMRVAWVPHPGLLEAYRGREHLVLAGKIDEKGMVGESSTHDEDLKRYLPLSKDGMVELLTSLEHFPYEHYGLELQE